MQSRKALLPIEVTDVSPRFTLSNEEHPLNVSFPIDVMPAGRTMPFSEEHPANAPAPIVFMPDGSVTLSSAEHPRNAFAGTDPMLSGSTTFLINVFDEKADDTKLSTIFPLISPGTVTFVEVPV